MCNLISAYLATLVVAAAFVGCHPFRGKDIPLVNEICDNTKQPAKRISTVAELNGLVEEINNKKIKCHDRIKSSIDDLIDLIGKHENDVCSQESADDIATYYRNHMAIKNETSNSLIEFPLALKKFFVAYGMKVSSFCRMQMADRLIEDADKLIEDADIEQVAGFTGQGKYIAMFMGDPSENPDQEHLALPKSFIKLMSTIESFDVTSDKKLLLQVSTTQKINRIQAVCERRFKPVYKDLILPLITLADLGFNYKLEEVKPEPHVMKQVYEWYRIVLLCEAITKVEFFEAQEDKEKGLDSDRRQVRLLNKEQADQLRANGSTMMTSVGAEFPQVSYKPDLRSMPLDGIIFDRNDLKLKKAIKTFRRKTRNEHDPDVVRKAANFLEDKITRGVIKVAGKYTGIKNLPTDGKWTGVDMVNLLDEYQHALETGDTKAIAKAIQLTKSDKIFGLSLVFIVLAIVVMCIVAFGICG